MCSKHKKTS